MDPSGPGQDLTTDDIVEFFERSEQANSPFFTAEIARALDCSSQAATNRLTELVNAGELRTKEGPDGNSVWWTPHDERSGSHEPGEEQLRAFVSSVKDYAIFMLDPEGNVVSWNEGAQRIKQYSEEEIVGEHFSTFYTEEDIADDVPDRNLETAAAEGRVEDEGWRVRADGETFWANVIITAIRDDEGDLQGFTKVTRDMTERRRYEQELQRERDFIEQILETAPVSIGIIGSDGQLLRGNSRMLERQGITADDLPDYALTSLDVYDEAGDPIPVEDQPWRRVLSTGDPVYGFQCQVEFPNGDRQWLSINAAPLEVEAATDAQVVAAVEDISEQKDRERQLEQRKTDLETELNEILGRISDAFYALDDEWRFTHLNDQAVEILGRPRDDLLGRNIWEVFPDASAVYEEQFKQAMDTQEPATFEVLTEISETWMEFNVYPSETGLSIYFRDVTERKEREQTLSKYETIVETVNDGIYVKDEDGYFTMVNSAYADLTGYDEDELIGKHASLVVDEGAIEQSNEKKEAMAAGGEGDPAMKAMIERADGGEVPAEATFATIDDADGETAQVGVVRDISDRLEYQRRIEESERRYRTLAENFPNGAVALFDTEKVYTAVGGQLLDAEGVDPEERIGESIFDIYPDDVIQEVEPYFDAALDGEEDSFELDFGGRHLLNHILPVEGANEAIDTGMLVVQDVTERKEYQRQLEESNERLEQFAYAASHDLQEPLRMVSSYLQLIEKRCGDDLGDECDEYLEFAVDGADRMREMIAGLLEYSRVETDGETLQPTDLEDVLSDVRDNLQVQIESTGATITAESLPTVSGDRDQLRHVLQNLVENGIKYSGEGAPRIEIASERVGDRWRVSVRDDGVGIAEEDQDQIFEVFERLHSRDEHAGTGIGLALCERIVERHGGDIWVDSEPGEGTTFSFTLPPEDGDPGRRRS